MMTHDEASLILVDRFFGRLDAAARDGVDGHAASCAACGAALATLGRLAGTRRDAAGTNGPAHLAVDRIVGIALGPAAGDAAGDAAGAGAAGDADRRHLESCRACAEEVAACRASVLEARSARAGDAAPWPRRIRPFVPSALAAALFAAILGYPAYRGLVDLPRARRQAEAAAEAEARSRSEASTLRAALESERAAAGTRDQGEVGLALYLDVTRGANGRTPAAELQPGARVVTILVEPPLPRSMAGSDPLRCEIRDREGRVVWSGGTTVGAIRDRRGAADRLLALLVPAAALPPGGYLLTLGRPGPGGVEKVIEAPFEITAPSPG